MDPAVNAVVTVGFLSVVIAYLIEWVRARFPALDGDLLRVVSIVIGIVLAFVYGLNVAADLGFDGLPDSLGKIATGLTIAGVSGFFGTTKNALRNQDPKSSIHSEG